MKIYIKLEAPFQWARVDGLRVQAFGEVPSLGDYPLNDEDEMLAVVSGEWVTTHLITLPAKTRKQFLAALPYALEESISEDIENIHFICPQWLANEKCVVYAVAKEKMQDWQELATSNKLPVAALLPDYSLLPMHEAAECSLSLGESGMLVKQQHGLGAYIENEFVDIWLKEVDPKLTIAINDKGLAERLIKDYPKRDFRYWGFGDKMAHWLEHPLSALNSDLLNEQYRPAVQGKPLRQFLMPAMILLFGVFLLFAFDTYRYLALHSENKKIDAEMIDVVKSAFPEIDIVIPEKERFMMEQAIARRGGISQQNDFQTLIALTAKVLKAQRISLSDIVYRDKQLIVTCILSDFSQADQIARQLNEHRKITASLESSSANGEKITARYRIKQG